MTDTTTVDLSTMLSGATKSVAPRVVIPAGMVTYLDSERSWFSTQNNRQTRTITLADPISTAILANRPRDLKTHDAGTIGRDEAAAKEFCRQVHQYAADHGTTAKTDRVVATVTFRIRKPSDKS